MEDESDAELAAQHAESEAAQAALDAELATLNAELAQREAALVVAYTQRSKAALKSGTAAALLADSEVALAYHVPKLHHKLQQQVLLQDLNLTPHGNPTLTAHTGLYPYAPRYPTFHDSCPSRSCRWPRRASRPLSPPTCRSRATLVGRSSRSLRG